MVSTRRIILGKLYITPLGIFSVLKDLEKATGVHRRTLIRRFRSTKEVYEDWFVIDNESPLTDEDLCEHCDMADNLLFAEGCWLEHVGHEHDTKLSDNDKIVYLFKGSPYQVTYNMWKQGDRPHLNLGEE